MDSPLNCHARQQRATVAGIAVVPMHTVGVCGHLSQTHIFLFPSPVNRFLLLHPLFCFSSSSLPTLTQASIVVISLSFVAIIMASTVAPVTGINIAFCIMSTTATVTRLYRTYQKTRTVQSHDSM